MSEAKKTDKNKNENLYKALSMIFGLLTFCGGGLLVLGFSATVEEGDLALLFIFLPSCLAPLLLGLLGQWMVKNRLRYQASRAVLLISLLLTSLGLAFTGMAGTVLALILDSDDASAGSLETLFIAGLCLLPAVLVWVGGGLLYRFGGGEDEEFPEEERAKEAQRLEESLKETDYDEYFDA